MIKAVFFDWSDTLARPELDQQEVVHRAAQESGIELPITKLISCIRKAESQVPTGSPARWVEGKDEEPFVLWWKVLLSDIGVKTSKEVMLQMTRRLKQVTENLSWVLYDDSMPTLKKLKNRGFVLGLITSMGEEMNILCKRSGIDTYLDFVVTLKEVDAGKPKPPIFLLGLERAKVNAHEAVYVGDRYETDVLGARGVGIKPILIDRFDLMSEVKDCIRIHSLTELDHYL